MSFLEVSEHPVHQQLGSWHHGLDCCIVPVVLVFPQGLADKRCVQVNAGAGRGQNHVHSQSLQLVVNAAQPRKPSEVPGLMMLLEIVKHAQV